MPKNWGITPPIQDGMDVHQQLNPKNGRYFEEITKRDETRPKVEDYEKNGTT
jgi:hypothetical protein